MTLRRSVAALSSALLFSLIPCHGQQTPLGQTLFWSNFNSFQTFGANEALVADGTVGRACDLFFSTADIYIVPAGSITGGGQALIDVSGQPNTVIGASGGLFVGETLGFTAPTGTVGAGMWAVVYDECQNGVFDAGQDALFDPAFEVILPSTLPPIDPNILAIKSAAAQQEMQACQELQAWSHIFFVANVLDGLAAFASLNPLAITYWLAWNMPPLNMFGTNIAIDALADRKSAYGGLAADPPDPNFQQPTTIAPGTPFAFENSGELFQALSQFASTTRLEAEVAQALLHSIERYQGAEMAGDGLWATAHAEACVRFGEQLVDCLSASNQALLRLDAALGSTTLPLEATASALEVVRHRVELFGFDPVERQALENLGFTPAEVQRLKDGFVSLGTNESSANPIIGASNSLGGFTVAGLRATIASSMALNAQTMTDVSADLVLLRQFAATVASDPGVTTRAPIPDAGGPYMAMVGLPVTLDGSASIDVDGSIVAYDWDLDGDGSFETNAPGALFVTSFAEPGETTVGLRVTDDTGNEAVAYAALVVAAGNRLPTITAVQPAARTLAVDAGESIAFQVTASDPENDPLGYSWLVNGTPVATGPTYTHFPPLGSLDSIVCRVSDGQHGSRAVEVEWIASALDCIASWQTFGTGVAGSQGVPQATPLANPVIGQTLTFQYDNVANEVAFGCLVFGLDQTTAPTPIGGTRYVATPFLFDLTMHQLPIGGATVSITLPDDPVLCGLSVFAQYFQTDSNGPGGFAVGPGMELVLGNR